MVDSMHKKPIIGKVCHVFTIIVSIFFYKINNIKFDSGIQLIKA